MNLKSVVKGLLTFVPGVRSLLPKGCTGGTNSALYCHEVWLKHLTMLWASGMRSMPASLAELGPGDSIGVGLAALLSGVDRYCALDVVRFSNTDFNLAIFDDLVPLFKERAGRTTESWPSYDRYLNESLFPSCILTEGALAASLSEERISRIRSAIASPGTAHDGVSITYMVPWLDEKIIEPGSVDVILSHAVLEHVADLESTYRALSRWLKPGGMMSHQIDFTAHGLAKKWNGYRSYSEMLWKATVGKRPFLINRQPCSAHVDFMERNGFEILCLMKKHRADGIARSQLSPRWRNISNDDLTCSDVFIQARKR
jgi:hypothetical protein